jgi:hypothetical protein
MTKERATMRIIVRVALLATALAAALASNASAVTWSNSGDTALTATGPTTTFHFNNNNVHQPCTSTAVSGTAATGPFSGTTWTNAVSLNVSYSHCTLSGIPYNIACSASESFDAQTGGVSSGTLATTCDITVFGEKVCVMSGTIPNTYTNPVSGTSGQFTLSQTTLALSNGPTGTCPYGTSATFTHQTWTVNSGTGGPVINRTP